MSSFPFLNLKELNRSLDGEIRAAMNAVLAHGQFVNGPEVRQFDREWAAFCQVPEAVGCANGTAAMHALLECLGVGPGDEVIVPSHTFVASAESIRLSGAKPVFVDIDPDTMLVDAASLRESITPRTRAISVVHLYGMPVDFDAVSEAAATNGIPVVEDACQAHGATYKGRPTGGLGAGAAFSFFPGKNLGAFGDAGAVTATDADLAGRLRRYVDHGRTEKYTHIEMGTNYRLDTLQAAVLLVKLRHLREWTRRRQELAARYEEILSAEPFPSFPVRLQKAPEGSVSARHLYVIRVANRDAVIEGLREEGVRTGIHYPIPCHLQPSMRDYTEGEGSLPHTEQAAREIISLPMCPTLRPEDAEEICSRLRRVLEKTAAVAS